MRQTRPWALLLLTFTAALAGAAERPYTAGALQSALAEHRPAAVVFHADWCPTCRAQAPVLKALSERPEFASVTVFVADFDAEKALKRTLNVSAQSTVVVFRNGAEVARATGLTDEAHLAALLHAATAPATR